jgi:hypothetical protein
MCKRQEHVISHVPYPTELSHMLVTCYTVIWRITQLYAQVFLTPYVSHSSCSTCRNVTSQTRTSALSHTTQDTQFLITWWHNFFCPYRHFSLVTKLTHLLRRKIILVIQKIIFSCIIRKEVAHISRTHETFFLNVCNKFSQNKSMY